MQFSKIRHPLIASRWTVAVLALTLAACSQHPTTTASADNASAPSATPPTPPAPPATPTNAAAPTSATGGEQDEADENGAPAARAATAPSDGVHRGPRVKGMQLGDSLDDVKREFSAVLNNPACTVYDASQSLGAGTYAGICNSNGVILAAMTFDSGRLSRLTFGSVLVNQTFGNLPNKAFVEGFMGAYGIPDMNPEDGPNNKLHLAYRDKGGWEADLFPDNSFTLRTIDTAAQQAAKFN